MEIEHEIFMLECGLTYLLLHNNPNYSGTETEIVIPSQLDTTTLENYDSSAFTQVNSNVKGLNLSKYASQDVLPVVGIEGDMENLQPLLTNSSNVNSVYIPSSVKYIGEGTFALTACTNSTQVLTQGADPVYTDAGYTVIFEINSQLTSLGGGAFALSGLTSINMPNGITSLENMYLYGGYLAFGTFENCIKLKSINIPESVQTISQSAFVNCRSLEEINFNAIEMSDISGDSRFLTAGQSSSGIKLNIGENVTRVPKGLFDGADGNPTNITEIVFKGDVCTEIASSAFEFTNISKITIPSSITTIGIGVFKGCSSLQTITIPASVTTIGTSAFNSCDNLQTITIPASVTTIESHAFIGCSSLQTVEFEEDSQLLLIGNYAFADTNLTSITIPASVRSLHAYAFSGCNNLQTVNFEDNSQMSGIGTYTFQNCVKLNTIQLEKTQLNSLGSNAFQGCLNLEFLKLPASLQFFSKSTFDGCTNFTEIEFAEYSKLERINGTDVIPSTIQSIKFGDYSQLQEVRWFENNTNLKSIDFGNNCELSGDIYSFTFRNCTNLQIVRFGNNSQVTEIGQQCFEGCINLQTVDFGTNSSLQIIGVESFKNCTNLQSITIPANVNTLYSDSFSGCSQLSTIQVEDNNAVFTDANSNCIIKKEEKTLLLGIKTTIIPTDSNIVTEILPYAFAGSALTNITIPSNISSIREYAFNNCQVLTSIVIPASTTRIIAYAFDGCTSLQKVYYHGNESDKTSNLTINSINNDSFINATWYYYNEDPSAVGNYWHYDNDGNIVEHTA